MSENPGQITLTRGRVALISPADFPLLSQYSWGAHEDTGGKWYACARNKKSLGGDGRVIKMHRLILGFPNAFVDHANGNGLDNRRENLRLATSQQNGFNKNRESSGTIYIGVYWFGRTKMWTGQVRDPTGNRVSIGYYKHDYEAALAREAIVKALHGEFAKLNFPPELVDAHRPQVYRTADEAAAERAVAWAVTRSAS